MGNMTSKTTLEDLQEQLEFIFYTCNYIYVGVVVEYEDSGL